MRKKATRKKDPTEVELEILNVLWEHGPCPLGTIHEELSDRRGGGYTTTQKMVQVMRDKGLITADTSVKPQLYRATERRDATRLRLVESMAHRAFEGSAKALVMSLLSSKKLKPAELAEIKQVVEEARQTGP